MMHSADMMC